MMVKVALALIALYRYGLRPLIGPRCRFFPSCSEYGEQAFRRHGFVNGALLTARRLSRCHPWHPGGVDEVPEPGAWRWRCAACGPAATREGSSPTARSASLPRH